VAGKLTLYEILRRLTLVQSDLSTTTKPILHLFKNNVTPSEATVLADLTEATFPGYAAASIDFTDATISGPVLNVYTLSPPGITFTRAAGAGGEDVYGYYVTDHLNAQLLWAQRDPAAPVDLSVVGASYTIVANLTGTDA
jgi:hypothetical protein